MSEIKIFNEGDDILASDTNYNNRLLEDRINTHSDEVQNFMKDQYSALETKIDSAQATLQERINELKAVLETVKSYVVETWEEGTNGYRIFSDGYCEQWGELASTGENGQYTVDLHLTMADMNYQVLATNKGRARRDDNWDYGTIGAYQLTESTIRLTRGRSGGAIAWFVHGKKKADTVTEGV